MQNFFDWMISLKKLAGHENYKLPANADDYFAPFFYEGLTPDEALVDEAAHGSKTELVEADADFTPSYQLAAE